MAQSSYQLINLTSNIVLTWPFSFAGGTTVADINDVSPNQANRTITMPDATLASVGQNVVFNNISMYSFQLLANDGATLIKTILAGEIYEIYLHDNSTSNGSWRVIPYGSGTNAIMAFVAESSDSSITIIDGGVTPPGGIIDFKLPPNISNINTISAPGIVVITDTNPLTWGTISLTAGTNIVITNPNGVNTKAVATNPKIELSSAVTGLSSLKVGELAMSGHAITNITENGGIVINANGTGRVTINNTSISASAFCEFTDTLTGSANTIVPGNHANVSLPITGSAGTYVINFITPMPSTKYGVLISLGSTGGSFPFISNGYSIVQDTKSVTIAVTDASGELVTAAPNGVTVMILSNE